MDNKQKNSYKIIRFFKRRFKEIWHTILILFVSSAVIVVIVLNNVNKESFDKKDSVELTEDSSKDVSSDADSINSKQEASDRKIILSGLAVYTASIYLFVIMISHNSSNKKMPSFHFKASRKISTTIPINTSVYIDSKISENDYLCFYESKDGKQPVNRINIVLPFEKIKDVNIIGEEKKNFLGNFLADIDELITATKDNQKILFSVFTALVALLMILFYILNGLIHGIPLTKFLLIIKEFDLVTWLYSFIPYISFLILTIIIFLRSKSKNK